MSDDEGVEVFLGSTGCSKPVILPSRTGMNLTAAQRRWRLLKNMRFVSTRLNSLTKKEKDFLDTLASDDKPVVDAQQKIEECGKLELAKQKLQEQISKKSNTLTEQEIQFLQTLIQSPNISAEYLEKTAQVLHNDPLYDSNIHLETGVEVTIESAQKVSDTGRVKLENTDCFRKEVWTHCRSSLSDDEESEATAEGASTPTVEEKKSMDEADVPKKKTGFVYKFFAPKPKKKEEEEEEDEQIDDMSVHFSILGTCVDDEECSPHVLVRFRHRTCHEVIIMCTHEPISTYFQHSHHQLWTHSVHTCHLWFNKIISG